MYHKISSLMLNLAKSPSGHREVFIAQPDNVTEKMAGKVFILFELETKKSDAKKIFDFLVNGIDDYYYQDEKIFLRDKIPGLELDNIFEAFLTKLNKALTEFLIEEKIRVSSNDFNITIGLVYESQLIFSNFGRNKGYLIYRKQDQYEIINVEASASDVEGDIIYSDEDDEETISEKMKNFKIFSSVITGDIPNGSYFFFTNENLPEYLSSKEMVLIITKLPPMVAAEQMKQSLSKVNSFAPFLGIIIKNTIGLSEKDERDEILESLSAQNSISSLNSTEKKTEDMLSPTGIVDSKTIKNKLSTIKQKTSVLFNKTTSYFKTKDKNVKKAVKETVKQSDKKLRPKIDVQTKIEVVRSSSILSKFFNAFKNFIVNIFSANFWSGFFTNFGSRFKSLNLKSKLLSLAVILLVAILVISILVTNRQRRLEEHNENFMASIAEIQERYGLIDSYIHFDEKGVKIIIGEIAEELSKLEALNEDQEEILSNWQDNLRDKRLKLQRLTIIDDYNLLFDTTELNSSAEPRNLVLFNDNLYITDPAGKVIYSYDYELKETSSNLINAGDDIDLQFPFVYNSDINYLNNNSLARVNPETGQYEEIDVSGFVDRKTDALDIYSENDLLYSLHSSENSILRHSPANSFTQFSNWLSEDLNLSSAIDMAVTGEIWILESNANIKRLWAGAKDNDFSLDAIEPNLNNATKLQASLSNLYVFDRNSKRLVNFNYDGSLVSQYQFSDLENIYDLVVDENNQKVYILSDTKIYSFDF